MTELARYLAALGPRECRVCGAPTGSCALDKCAEHDDLFFEYGPSECATHTTTEDPMSKPRRSSRDEAVA